VEHFAIFKIVDDRFPVAFPVLNDKPEILPLGLVALSYGHSSSGVHVKAFITTSGFNSAPGLSE
jgi:hypothetical protein